MNDEKYKKFFYNNENLENVYNILKGDEKQLKKETVKKRMWLLNLSMRVRRQHHKVKAKRVVKNLTVIAMWHL